MKKLSSIISIAIIILSIFICSSSYLFTFSLDSEQTTDDSYRIESYNAQFEYKEGRTFSVTETVTVVFNRAGKHGIIRDLAINSGEVYSDISVADNTYELRMENINFLSIYIGSEYFTVPVNQPTVYVIKYDIKIPVRSNKDEFALNVLGGGWATSIEEFTCTVTLPSSPEQTTLAGGEVEQSSSGDVYTITASNLSPFQAITLYAIFAEGTLPSFAPDAEEIIAVIVAFAALAAVVALCILIPKRKPVEVVNFYPPENIDPLQAGTLIDGTPNDEDVTSLFYYWAAKGYIDIDFSDENDPLFIMKSRLPEGKPQHQLILFNKIFQSRDRVSVSNLPKDLAYAASTAKAQVKASTPKAFSAGSRIGSEITMAIAAIIYVAVIIGRGLAIGLFFPLAFIAALGPLCIYLTGDFGARNRLKYSKKKRTLIFAAQLAETAAFTVAAFFAVPQTFILDYMNALLALACCGIAVASPYLLRYTKAYSDAVGPLLGFRNFIELAEKDRLEKLIKENPEYYYDVLPYAQVLGVSDAWIKKFKDINLCPPQWARGYRFDVFDYVIFTSVMRSTWRGAARAFVPPPSGSGRSGGGRFGGGGGFGRGGGFGGGGGRSW